MKSCTFPRRMLLCSGALFSLSLSAALAANDTTSPQVVVSPAPAPAATLAPASADAAPPRLPYGVDDVLKLSRAQVSDDIIQNYIQSTGTIYNLGPQDIVYLRNQGVSDRIVNAMLDQRRLAAQTMAQAAPAPAPAPAATTVAPPSYNYEAAPTDVQPQPTTVTAAAPSSLYVIPYPQATSAYYGGYYGYPYPYYNSPYYYGGYWGPSISLGFGFGGGWGGWGGWRGGDWHGGGGGWHGGGFHGGWHGHH